MSIWVFAIVGWVCISASLLVWIGWFITMLQRELTLARNTLIKLSCFSVDGISDLARDVASQAATRIEESGLVK